MKLFDRVFDLKIGARVALAFGLVLLTIAATTGIVQVSLAHSARNTAAMGESSLLQAKASQAHLQAKDNAIASMMVLVSSSADQQSRLKQEIQARDAQIDKSLEELQAGADGSPEQATLLADIRKRHATYRAGVSRILDLMQAGKQAEASFAADEEMIPMLAPFLKGLAALDDIAIAKVRETEAANGRLIERTQWLSAGAGLGAAAIAAAAGIWLVLGITRPLSRALAFAERVSTGDLSTQIEADGRDELSVLLRTLNRMNENLARIVNQVRNGSDSIATGSAQIATGNHDLSQRTEVQASALEQTAASMEQLHSTVKQNADNARQANQLAMGASSVAEKGGKVVGEVVTTMKGINDSSKKIADIVGVIDSIAFQTNILALNAAVEAARAGEQGRGFAVVASEVRSLAGRSAEAAREIKRLITVSVERVDHGTALVDRAGATMTEVVASIQRVTAIMGEISAASAEQSAGVSQVGEAVTQMDQVTQQNAALVEESAAAAESLKQQAQQLAEAVAVFKLVPNGRAADAAADAAGAAARRKPTRAFDVA